MDVNRGTGPGTDDPLTVVATATGDLIARGEALVASAEEFQAEAQAYLLGEVHQLVAGDVAELARGMTAPPGFLEWRALGTFTQDNVRLLRLFVGDVYDGMRSAGNLAITNAMDYEHADRAGEIELGHVEESLALQRPVGGADGGTTTVDGGEGAPVSPRTTYQQRTYSPQHTGWTGMSLEQICDLIFGALAQYPMELAIRWEALAGTARTAYDGLEAMATVPWEGAAGAFFRSILERSRETMTGWIEGMPDRAASLGQAGAELAGAQAELTGILNEMYATIKKYEELIARTTDPAKIAEYRRRIEEAKERAQQQARQVGARLGGQLVADGPWSVPPQFQGFHGLAEPAPRTADPGPAPGPYDADNPLVLRIDREPLLAEETGAPTPLADSAMPYGPLFGPTGGLGAGGNAVGEPRPGPTLGGTPRSRGLGDRAAGALGVTAGGAIPAGSTGTASGAPGAYGRAAGLAGDPLAGRGAGRAPAPVPARPTVLPNESAPAGGDGQLLGRLEAVAARRPDAVAPPAVPPPLGAGASPLAGRTGIGAAAGPAAEPAPGHGAAGRDAVGTPQPLAAGGTGGGGDDQQQRRGAPGPNAAGTRRDDGSAAARWMTTDGTAGAARQSTAED